MVQDILILRSGCLHTQIAITFKILVFFVPPSHMSVCQTTSDKGPQATSKGNAPLVDSVAAMGKCKQANEFQLRHNIFVITTAKTVASCSQAFPGYSF